MMKSVEAELDAAAEEGTTLVEGLEARGSEAQVPQLQAAAAGGTAQQPGGAPGTREGEAAAATDEEMPSAAGAGDGQ